MSMPAIPFLSDDQARAIGRDFGTPVFVYDVKALEAQMAPGGDRAEAARTLLGRGVALLIG